MREQSAEREQVTSGPLLRVSLFGPLHLEWLVPSASDEDAWHRRTSARALFCLLVCAPQRRASRSQLAGILWPEVDEQHAVESLRVATKALRTVLRPANGEELLHSLSGSLLQLADQTRLEIDVDAFDALVQQASTSSGEDEVLTLWEQAKDLVRGEFLADQARGGEWSQHRWVKVRQQALRAARRRMIRSLTDLSIQRGQDAQAEALLQAHVIRFPFDQDALYRLMKLLIKAECFVEARAAYERCRAIFADFGKEPAEHLKALEERLSPKSQHPIPYEYTKQLQREQPEHSFPSTHIQSGIEHRHTEILPPLIIESHLAMPHDSEGPYKQALVISSRTHTIHWGEAPSSQQFYGREKELDELQSWVIGGHCRLLAILGMGGIGKTSLAVALVNVVKDSFEYIFWRSLQQAPSFHHMLHSCIKFLSDQQEIDFPDEIEDLISLLLFYLREHRCLLVFDNCETVFQSGKGTGVYRDGYEDYGRLFQRVGEAQHQSCLLLTSREKTREVALLEGKDTSIRSFHLYGLKSRDGANIVQRKGIVGEAQSVEKLIDLYAGNPLALKLVSQFILEVFNGEITAFLRDGQRIFSDIQDVLDQQVQRLSPLEQEIMYWLAIERETVSFQKVNDDLVHPVPRRMIQAAFQSLRRRYLIETSASGFTLQNVVMEYMTERFVTCICEELHTGVLSLFSSHALMQALAKEYVRESQIRLILQPVAQYLLATFGKGESESTLKRILTLLQETDTQKPNYTAGNSLNLLIQLGYDLHGYNFSHLTIKQAYLRGVSLPEVSFASSHLINCAFTETFGGVLSVAFSPDGKLVAAGTTDGEIRLWNITQSIPLFTFQGHTDWVYAVAFSPDNKTLISGSDDQSVRIWDIDTRQTLKVLRGHTHWILTVALSPDGKILVSGGEDRVLLLWDVETGQLLKTLQGHRERVWSVAFSPDGKFIASGSEDQHVHLWDVETGQLLKIFQGHTGSVWSVAFSPDGKSLVSCGEDAYLILWNRESDRQYQLKSPRNSGQGFWSVAFSPSGNFIGTGCEDGHVYLWQVDSEQPLKVLSGHGRIRSVVFSPDGRMVMSGGQDPIVRLWDIQTGYLLKTLQGYSDRIWSVAFSPDGKQLVSGGEDLAIHLWDVSTGHLLRDMQGHRSRIWSVVFSSTGKMLASSSNDQSVRLWDTTMQKPLMVLREAHRWIYSLIFSPDEKLIIGGSGDQRVYLWECATGRLCRVLIGHTGEIWSVACSPNGMIIASGSEDKTIRLWETQTGSELKVLQGHASEVWSLAFSPDGQMLISGGADQCLRLWEVKTGREVSVLRGHSGDIRSVVFNPNGQLVVSGSDDLSVRVWDMKTGQVLQCLQGHTGRVRSVAFSSDGETVASGSADGTTKLWDWQTGKCLKTLRCRRPYEQMKITGTTGLTEDQRNIIKALGACE